MKKFWNWIHDEDSGRILRLEGPVDSDNLWGDEITPEMFRNDLEAEDGDVTVWINSPGGNVFAAAEIYTMLKDYKGSVTVRVASIAASAASVIAMAGDRIQMSPTALLMVHDPSTIAMGNARDMEKAIETLNEVKESIINAYAAKTGLRRSRISELMENETWLNARKALELGFCDEILFEGKAEENPGEETRDAPAPEAQLYSTRVMDAAILDRLRGPAPEKQNLEIGMDGKTPDGAVPYRILMDRLDFLR